MALFLAFGLWAQRLPAKVDRAAFRKDIQTGNLTALFEDIVPCRNYLVYCRAERDAAACQRVNMLDREARAAAKLGLETNV